VFHRIAQQVLEYLHVPHDLPLAPQHQLLLAAAKTKEKDLEEGTPDHPGEPLETAEVGGTDAVAVEKPLPLRQAGEGARPTRDHPIASANVAQAAMREAVGGGEARAAQAAAPISRDADAAQGSPAVTGTVVLNVEQGGIEVPSFLGKTVRRAVEAAQDAGLELEAVGSGVARGQSPAAGTHVAAGAHITVQFGH
jgi:cell division protein FtsI (penicillin-binding protein 3)